MKQKVAIYWSRRDFRLEDNPALFSAISYSKKENTLFLPIFILEDYMTRDDFPYASRQFLIKALPLFTKHFKNFLILKGKAAETIIKISKIYDITVFVNEDVYKDFYAQINKIKNANVNIKLYSDALTINKETKTINKNIYSVFTPFKNAVWGEFCDAKALPSPNMNNINYLNEEIKIDKCDIEELDKIFSKSKTLYIGNTKYNLNIESNYSNHYFNEENAKKEFDNFLKNKIINYKKDRDFLDIEANSRMSIALAWGLVSPRYLKTKIQKHFKCDFTKASIINLDGPIHYISELIWREFYKYLLYHYPFLMNTEFQEKYRNKIKWIDEKMAEERFKKWINGETRYPIVDAAMTELKTTGYMHNRARMIVASILTKNLGVNWRWGQEYFRFMLLDLDEASNNGGWQWAASVGADPKPIRIFNPYLQAENYDKDKVYQNKYLRKDYFENPPKVIIEHKDARVEALRRYGLGK